MAKPFGEGLKYMQLDVDIYDNDKVDMLRDKFSDAGFLFWVLIHNRIFKDSYYWLQDEVKVNSFCRKVLKKTREEYNTMVAYAIEIKVFDKEIFEKYGVLTSKGIQRRYLIITKKWSKVKLINEYIIEGVDVYPFQVTFHTREGRYIGYKKKNDEEIHSDDFIPRSHKSKEIAEENRAEIQSIAVKEYFESQQKPITEPVPAVNIVKNGTVYHPVTLPIPMLEYYKDDELSKDVCDFFGINEVKNFRSYALFTQFMTVLNNSNQLDYFRDQFKAYKEYKVLNNAEKFKHSFDNFIGHQDQKFEDGAWNAGNWEIKLQDSIKSNKKSNGKQSREAFKQPDEYNQI